MNHYPELKKDDTSIYFLSILANDPFKFHRYINIRFIWFQQLLLSLSETSKYIELNPYINGDCLI